MQSTCCINCVVTTVQIEPTTAKGCRSNVLCGWVLVGLSVRYSASPILPDQSERRAVDFDYDGVGRLKQEVGFDGRTRQYQYDEGGMLLTYSEGDQATLYERDSTGLLKRKLIERTGHGIGLNRSCTISIRIIWARHRNSPTATGSYTGQATIVRGVNSPRPMTAKAMPLTLRCRCAFRGSSVMLKPDCTTTALGTMIRG